MRNHGRADNFLISSAVRRTCSIRLLGDAAAGFAQPKIGLDGNVFVKCELRGAYLRARRELNNLGEIQWICKVR